MPEDQASSQAHENDNLKPGAPPRSKTEPHKDEDISQNPHTQTDPQSGEPNKG